MNDLLWLLLFPSVVTAGVSAVLTSLRPSWSLWNTVLAAALPLPIVMASVCIWLFVGAITASEKSCGVDACGTAMMFSVFGLGYALAAFALGAFAAFWIKRSGMRR